MGSGTGSGRLRRGRKFMTRHSEIDRYIAEYYDKTGRMPKVGQIAKRFFMSYGGMVYLLKKYSVFDEYKKEAI